MVKNYRAIQQWDNWLNQQLGANVLLTEKNFLSTLLVKNDSSIALLIGAPTQNCLLKNTNIPNQIILSPLINKYKHVKYIECGFFELSILTGSVDLVVLPHTLEFIEFPQQLLAEACRTIKPGGNIIIMGFNPVSFWGLKKFWQKGKTIPWSGRYLLPDTIKKWLHLNDFEFLRKDMIMFRPPIENQNLFNNLQILETIGTKSNAFFGGIYAITAKAKVVPLTPIKLRWKQSLSKLSVTIPGPTMRDIQ